MSQTALTEQVMPSVTTCLPDQLTGYEDSSPFGLQGLARRTVKIIKPDAIERLAVNLAMRANQQQILDREYVQRTIDSHPEWSDEYQIVHLIEKSLWIQGHSDLVMTMTKNPSQIPDNPPPKITQALINAYTHHPDATIWYGVPLFSDEKNEDGLPIPVSADQVRIEANRRIEAAQQHALRWRWFFRAALTVSRVPLMCWHSCVEVKNRIQGVFQGIAEYWKKCRQDARRRARAIYMAEMQHCRMGCSMIEVPEHSTWLGKSLETACVIFELMAFQAKILGVTSPFFGIIAAPVAISQFIPVIFVPVTIMTCDPFLFVELPEEPGKLRHIGHWYWQKQDNGQEKLHLHV